MTTLTSDQLRDLSIAVRRADPDADLYADYSGRGMYGAECVGIVAQDTDQLMYQLGYDLSGTELGDILARQRTDHDSMGLREIVYFPQLQAPTQEDN
jgi:hypothetical protein